MGKKMKKQLLSSAPWRDEESGTHDFENAKLKVTKQPGTTSTMYVPGKKSVNRNLKDEDQSLAEIDPELRYSFQRNFQEQQGVINVNSDPLLHIAPPDVQETEFEEALILLSNCFLCRFVSIGALLFLHQVFSIDTIVKPLPPAMAYNVSRNLGFFTRIFTQFFDPEGIASAQKSLGLGTEEKVRRVR